MTGTAPVPSRPEVVRKLSTHLGQTDSLEQLSAFAAQLLGTSSAQVTLISDVQMVVGAAGLGAASVGRETPAKDSMCSLPVASGEPVAIADAPTDERVRAMLPVASGMVRSYLGVPLSARGHLVGSLCVFDEQPREWSAADVELLGQLAAPVMAELEFATVSAEYRDDRLRWQLAVDAAEVGAFDWALRTDELRWDERLLELFGLTTETFGGTIGAFSDCVHIDDRAMVADAIGDAIATCGIYAAEYRIVRPDGTLRWIRARGRALAGADGVADRLVGAAYDTTAVIDGEASVRRVLEAMPTIFVNLDRDWRFSYLNTAAKRLFGGTERDLETATIWDLFPAMVGTDVERQYREAVRTGAPVQNESYYPAPLSGWYDARGWPTPDGLSIYLTDVTERHVAQELAESNRERRALLAGVTDAVAQIVNVEEAAIRLARLVVGPLADWSLVSLVDDPKVHGPDWHWRRGLRDVAGWHADPARRAMVDDYRDLRVGSLTEDSMVARALTSQAPVVTHRGAEVVTVALAEGEARDALLRLGPASAVMLPLRGRDRTLGLLTVYRDPGRPGFDDDDVEMLEEATARVGLALDNTRLYVGQREFSETLQRSLLTAPPEQSYLEIAVRYTPAAEVAQVGGDWYDAFCRPDGSTVIAIGDVVGHDSAAAAAMGQVRGLMRGIGVTTDAGPAQILTHVDAAIETLQLDTTATAVLAEVSAPDPSSHDGSVRMVWSNAGHPPPLLFDPPSAGTVGSARCLDSEPKLLLGLDAAASRSEQTLDLPVGSTVLFYTDGMVERRDQGFDDGIAELRRRGADLMLGSPDLEHLCDELLAGMLPSAPEDDVALLVFRVRAGSAGPT